MSAPVRLRIRSLRDYPYIDRDTMTLEYQLAMGLAIRRHTDNLCALLEDRMRPTLAAEPGFSVRVPPVLRLVEAHA